MIRIDPSFKVILTYSPIIEITGHIFECFDYYLFLRQYFKTGILFFNSLDLSKIKCMFESKYNIDFSSVVNDIITIDDIHPSNDKQIITFGANTTVILTDGNIQSLQYNKLVLSTTKLFGFMCEDERFKDVKSNNHIVYLQDYRVHGKNKYFKSVNYVKKLPFKFYKKATSPNQNIGMMYVTYVCRKVKPEVIKAYHEKSGCSQTLLVVPYKLPEYDNIPNITQVEAPLDNFFDKFDTYIYTPVNRKFDCSPRLVTECFMYNKKVYKELDYYDVGLETRYNDCLNNLDSLNLTENDDILKIIGQ